ncbi:MAG TPA: ribosome maturation factor RimM [Chloroflexota bacterium]|nr:ribosome maturation factor RimM [Chloroflexota bacterium]
MAETPEWLVVGKIVAAFGTKGEIRVMSQTDFPERFEPGAKLFVERELEPFAIEHSRWQKGQAVLKLGGVDDRDRAESLHGRYLRVPGEDIAALEEDRYYLFQIMGLKVITDEGQELGQIGDILQTGANDVYVVPTAKGELLLPAIADVVKQVDLPGGRLVVHLLPGLMPGAPEDAG